MIKPKDRAARQTGCADKDLVSNPSVSRVTGGLYATDFFL